MGMIGRWIDGLDDQTRDKIVTAQGMSDCVASPAASEGCLVQITHPDSWQNQLKRNDPFHTIGSQYDRLCRRFGLERVVRCCKLRAGATVDGLTEPEPTEAKVGA